MATSFQIPDSMLYSTPSKTLDGELNFVEFQPVSGSQWNANESFKIRLSSPDQFLIPSKSYLQFRIRGTGGTTHASGKISNLGGVSCIKRITTYVGGVQLEDIDNYNHYCSMLYKRMPSEYQTLLGSLEGTAITATEGNWSFHSGGNEAPVINHSLRTALFEGHNNLIPLPFIRGGIEVEFTLDNAAVCGNGGATLGNVVIDQVRLVCGMSKPPVAYLQQYQKSLEAGGEPVLPLQVVRSVNYSPTSSTSQDAIVSVGYLKSLRSVMGTFRTSAAAGNNTAFGADNLNGLTEYYFQIGTTRYPLNKTIKANAAATSPNAENLMQALCSVDNTFVHMNAVSITATTGAVVYFNWCPSPSFGNGVAVEDGQVRVLQTYSSVTSTSGTFLFYWTFDSLLKISASSITVDSKNV